MTSRLMKALPRHISMTILVVAAVGGTGAAVAGGCAASVADNGGYPTFCSIPRPAPVSSPTTIHGEVLETRLAGRALDEAVVPSTFTLDATTDFSGRAITEAAAPPPVTTSSLPDTEAFARAARAQVKPPKKHRH